jgi:hypothetical protein
MIKQFLISTSNLGAIKSKKKQLLILSDDWGSVRIKSRQDQKVLQKKGLPLDSRFDKFDSLETNQDLELLFEVLTKYKDFKGNHPVITAVTNLANPDFDRIADSNFKDYVYETIDQTYKRYSNSDRVLSLIRQGINQNIFIPQSHGREHLQVNWWMKEIQDVNSFSRIFFENEYYFTPPHLIVNKFRNRDFSASFDVMTENDIINHKKILISGLDEFKKIFGFNSKIFTPPAMFYSPRIEQTIYEQGIQWLDVGRLFKVPKIGGGESYQFNYLGRKKKSGLKVLVRNGMFEPNILASDNGVNRALYEIECAFNNKQPAILSNHRAAFVGRIDVENRNNGLRALDELISKVLTKWPDIEFISSNQL